MSRRWIGQYDGETLVNVKADVDEAMAMLESLHGNRTSMRRRILSGIGPAVKQHVKICYDPDSLCERETVNHPLTYFRIKTNPRGSQQEKPRA